MSSEIERLTKNLIAFRDARDWKQFHNPKDVALSLTLEAAEVLEHFQWKTGEEMEKYAKEHKDNIGEELADVMGWVLVLAHDLGIDIVEACDKKIAKNDVKYPADKSKGRATKYTEL